MKKYALVFLSVFLFISAPFAAYANIVTATGKYIINAVKHAPGGAKVEATNTATAAKHVIKHGVSSADLGKSIGAGIVGFGVGTGAGLAFKAITGLALDAVDWLLNPDNTGIIVKKPPVKVWYGINGACSTGIYSTPQELCAANGYPFTPNKEWPGDTCGGASRSIVSWTAKPTCAPSDFKGAAAGGTDQNISFDELAAKILELADSGDPVAQKTIEDYVTNLAKEGKLDNELDNAPDITQPENPEEPNPEEPQECPSGSVKVDDVCVKIPDSDGDEPLFCDSSEFTKKVCDWIDWTQEEPEEVTPEQIDIKEVDADNSNKIDMSGECPAPYQLNFSISGYEQNHSISYEPLCGALVLLKPIFVGSGALSGMFILMGYSRASNTGVN